VENIAYENSSFDQKNMSSVLIPPTAPESEAAPELPQRDPDLIEWGDEATVAREADALKPAWKKFIKTKFFVTIRRSPDDDPKNFLLHTTPHPDNGKATLVISEVRERLDVEQGDGTVALSGADILGRLAEGCGILVTLHDSTFSISRKRVDWLRSGIKVTRGRVIIRKILHAAAPAAPLPVLRVGPASSDIELVPEPAAQALPLWTAILESPHFKPGVLALLAFGILGAIIVSNNTVPDDIPAPAPIAAAVPVPKGPLVLPTPSGAGPVYPSPPSVQGTYTFTPANTSFTVSVPGLAEEVELPPDQVRQMGDIQTNRYRLEIDKRLYTMEATDFGERPLQAPAVAMDAVQKALLGSDGILTESSRSLCVASPGAKCGCACPTAASLRRVLLLWGTDSAW
jgi:hypothetical protein